MCRWFFWLGCCLPGTILGLNPWFPAPAVAQIDPLAIKICVNGLLFDQVFANGRPAGRRTIVDPRSAAIACQGVRTLEQAQEIKTCVNSLLFESVFPDGRPSGPRTFLEPRVAAVACAPCPQPNFDPFKP